MQPLLSREARRACNSFETQALRALKSSGSDISLKEFKFLLDTKMKSDQAFAKKVDAKLRSFRRHHKKL